MNVAVAAARLDVPSAFVGCLSTDDYGRQIRDHLDVNGVDTRACEAVAAPTARAIVEHTPKLVFRFEGVDTADTLLSAADLARLDPEPRLLHGGTLGMFRGRTAETLASLVEGFDGVVSIDPNVRPQIIDDRQAWDRFHRRWLDRADVYKASDEDLAWIWPDRSPDASAEAVLARGAAVVIVTRGGDGLTVLTPNGARSVTAPAVEVVDTVGAGDTIVAAMLAALWEASIVDRAGLDALALDDWAAFGRRAVEAAAITCTRPGADPPHRHEVDW